MRASQAPRSVAKAMSAVPVCLPRLALVITAIYVLALIPQLVAAQTITAQRRIVAPIDESSLIALRGNTHPLANAQNDRGTVADSQPMRRMLLLLQRSPDQESALRQLLDEQQSRSSPNYHQWLTPDQFGRRFGPADTDIQTVTGWLESHGFTVTRVSAGKTVIEFSGNAGQLREAFRTEIHRYLVDGQEWLANASDPQMPAALAGVVAGPVSLHNFPSEQLGHVAGTFRKNRTTGEVTPLFTFTATGCPPCNALGPGDFAAIYDIQQLWNPSSGTAIDGTGQTIAIVGDSDICTINSPDFPTACNHFDDVANFRSVFGLPAKSPIVIVDGPNPGLNPKGGEPEGDFDVEWAGAVAKNATIDFVIAQNTETTYGFDLAAEYVVDNNLAPILSSSFGACEGYMGTNGNNFESSLWEQAAAQGITVIVAAGDSGSAGCDNRNLSSPNAAKYGTFVSGVASTPFNVAAGGTDFDFGATNYQSTYWSGGNAVVNGINEVSATQYIPETTWNDSCAQSFTNATTGCNSPTASSVNILAGAGGQSNCSVVNSSGTGCVGFHPKPAWQAVASGSGFTAANDYARDLPDISLFSAYGPVTDSFYIVCEADIVDGPCRVSSSSFDFLGFGGTSAAAPTFAGIMAMVNQNMAGLNLPSRQGNANYGLYHLAATQSSGGLNCNSSTTPDSRCTFNDVTKGNNSVPCASGSSGCSDTSSDGAYGILEEVNSQAVPNGTAAFSAGAGFDLATGLGSVNAFNLVENWPGAIGAFTPTSTTLCLSTTPTTLAACVPGPITIQYGQPVYVYSSVTPNGSATPIAASWSNVRPEDVALIGAFAGGGTIGADAFDANSYIVSSTDIFQLNAGTVSGTETTNLIGGTYIVTARYAGDGTYGASTSPQPGIPVTVTALPTTAVISVSFEDPMTGIVRTNLSSNVIYGFPFTVRVDVSGCAAGHNTPCPFAAAPGQRMPSGTVALTDNGIPIVDSNGNPAGTFALNSEGYVENRTAFLGVGTHNLVAIYSGDLNYSASPPSGAIPFTVLTGNTTVSISPNPSIGTPGTSMSLTATVNTDSLGSLPAGTITFTVIPCQGCAEVPTQTVNLVPTTGPSGTAATQTASAFTFTPAGSEAVQAFFNPAGANPGYNASASEDSIEVGYPSFNIQPLAVKSLNMHQGDESEQQTIDITGTYAFAGTITLTCSVTPANLSDPPTCSFVYNAKPLSPPVLTFSPSSEHAFANVALSTAAATALLTPSHPLGPNRMKTNEILIVFACLLPLGVIFRRQRGMLLLIVLIAAVTTAGIGCGGGGSGNSAASPTPPNPGTAVGMYSVTITATPSTGTPQQVSFTLSVQ